MATPSEESTNYDELNENRRRYLLGYKICREVRIEGGIINDKNASYYEYMEKIEEKMKSLGDEGIDLDEFELMLMASWDNSAGENKSLFGRAEELYQVDPLAYDDPRLPEKLRRAATFCMCLHQVHEGENPVWFLSSRQLGTVLGLSWRTCNLHLKALESLKVIKCVQRHVLGTRDSSEFQFLGAGSHITHST